MRVIRVAARYAHSAIQLIAVLLVAWSIWKLTGSIGWASLFVGLTVLAWSILSEMSKPIRKRDNGPNLRNVA